MKAVIFDMDGVLIDSMKYHVPAWNTAFKKFNVKIPVEQFKLFEGADFQRTILHFKKNYNITITKQDKLQIYKNKQEYMLNEFKLEVYSEIKKILKYIKLKKLKLAVVTGSSKDFVNMVVDKKFKNIFDVIVCSDDVKKSKPAPDPYLKAVELLKLSKNEMFVIENAPLGIKSAKKAGLQVFALETTLNKKHLTEANKIFKNHKELFEYVKKII